MDQLNPSEISELIKQRIAKADIAVSAKNEGTIVSVSDGIVRIYGLADVMYGEMIEFDGGIYGMALNLSAIRWVRLFLAIIRNSRKDRLLGARVVFLRFQLETVYWAGWSML